MRYKILTTFTIITISIFSVLKADQPTICSHCNCTTFNESLIQVNCTSEDVTSMIFDTTNSSSNENSTDNDIRTLIIRKNELTTLKSIFKYEQLELLDISGNGIVHIEDNVFRKLRKLQTLILSHNNIESISADAFQGEYEAGVLHPLKSLRTILLDHNKLHSLNADLFAKTEKIETLSLAYNPLKVIDTNTAIAITNLVNLKNLDLSYTQIDALPKYFLHTPRYVTVLNLSGNYFTHVPLELKEAMSIQTFVFNDNPLVNLTKENGFPYIPTLRTLHLCQMPELVSIGPSSMANLTNLEELFIAGNPKLYLIDTAALAVANKIGTYESWPSIKKLYLNDNQLTYMNKSLLARWDSLAELDLLDNPWTCECENSWMVDTLMPIYVKIDEEKAKKLKCAAPVEMVEFTFYQLYRKNYHMRCLDWYGAMPEKDAALVVGMLAGVLIGIPIVLFCIYSYRRHWFGIFDDSPAAFSRQFYNRTRSDVYEY